MEQLEFTATENEAGVRIDRAVFPINMRNFPVLIFRSF